MVEIHGWITLRETYRVVDEEDMERVSEEIGKEIHRLTYPSLQIKVQNGQYFLEFSLYTNHMSNNARDLLSFFEKVGSPLISTVEDEDELE